eukprot:792085-Alexandrium_andersonii.AAC.1
MEEMKVWLQKKHYDDRNPPKDTGPNRSPEDEEEDSTQPPKKKKGEAYGEKGEKATKPTGSKAK